MRREGYLEAVLVVFVLFQEVGVIDNGLWGGNPQLEYPLVHGAGLLQSADALDEINVETPKFPALVYSLLRGQSLIEVVDGALLRRLGSLSHDCDRFVEVVVAKLQFSPFNPHICQFLDRLEGHPHSLLHNHPRLSEVAMFLIKLGVSGPE